MPEPTTLLPGTLDVLILKAVSLGPQHGYGILRRVEQITGGALLIKQGGVMPTRFRLPSGRTELWLPMTRRLFSVDEYHTMAEVGVLRPEDRVELIDGEILRMSPMGARRIWCLIRISRVLTAAFAGDAFVGSQLPLRLGGSSEPEPDLMLPRHDADMK